MVGTTYFNENQIHIDNFSCIHLYDTYNLADLVTYENVCIRIITDKIIDEAFTYQSLNILHSNSFFLTGLKSYWSTINNKTALGFIDVKYYVPWIRGILNKHGTVNSCVLPIVEGVVYSHEGSHEILSPGTLINHHRTVVENCEVGYHKAYTNGSRFCRENGKWLSNSEKLCFKMCPPLLSDSLDIKCSYNGKNSNCSNLSIPNTTATLSCKPTYSAPNGLQDTTLEINCQSNGIWDKQQYACKPTNVCVLPTAEGVLYTYEDSNEILSHGTLINHNLTVNENCEVGYHKAYPNSFRVCQRNGKWKTISENLCLKMCPPLLSYSLDIKCFLNGKDANCSSPSIPGTIAIPSCKTTHKLPNGQEETPLNINCQSNGIWDNHLYECEPYCGKNYSNTKLLIANGQNASFGTAPWNVAIYRLNEKSHKFICGGSIIGPNLVISAAHCFWNTTITSNTIFVNDSFYKIAVGKYAKDFTVIDNIFTKIMDVEMVYLKDCFNGYTGRYAEDIAIILLKNRIDFNDGVGPACIDWKGKFNVANGDIGKIVGWGEKEGYFKSPILLEASLPYFNNSFCRKMFNTEFVSFVTPDKFCAGSTSVSGQRVGGGDSGAGLCFVHSDLYYLTGVVSSKDPETNYSIAAFTNIQSHIDWISELYIKHK
ncbi:modular serine protease-like [Metopolophium dirhodum]|uniref:modular serine protease-like n=1 Tax=Metopolophium dirhodum TaxID=44670 RepID=UPI0029903327|nr:modular serine protease-like [Metopolophium dirhodum]